MTKRFNFSSISVAVMLIAAFFVTTLGVVVNAYAASDLESGQRLITIHDRGVERSIITREDTLREAFYEANILIDPNDMVEPGLDETLASDNYQVNVYRARPVTVVDGNNRIRVMSAYQTPKQIAAHAGFTLQDEDIATMTLPDDPLADEMNLQLVIDRATAVKLVLYGKSETVYTQTESIAEFLKEKNIQLAKKDTLSVEQNESISANMKIEIWRNGEQIKTRKEKIAFSVRQIQDTNRPVGYKKVTTKGAPGKKMVTYKMFVKNGKVVKKKLIRTVVLKKATQQVEVIGTKVKLPSGSHEDWMRSAGISSSDFGYVNYIFQNESGWNPAAANPAGYYGLGQTSLSNISGACPSWQTDPVCQTKWFNGYAASRYGSWGEAYRFKTNHGWW